MQKGISALKKIRRYSSVPKRLGSMTFDIARFYGVSQINKLQEKNSWRLKQADVENTSLHAKKLLSHMGGSVTVHYSGKDLFKDKNYLLVGNHMSYIDILVLSSKLPSVFVTSKEMQETFFLGDICRAGGSLFVERRSRAHIKADLGVISETISKGFNVVVYPEGTSGNGKTVGKFKSTLFQGAMDHGTPVLPICVRYKSINGQPFNEQNHSMVCWYGDMSFGPHFLKLNTIHSLEAELYFLQPLHPKDFSNRRELAENAYNQVVNQYHQNAFPAW